MSGSRNKFTDRQEQYIVDSYANGRGKYANEIARELICYPQMVSNCLRRHGVVIVKRWNSPRGNKSGGWTGGKRTIKGYAIIPLKHVIHLLMQGVIRDRL